MGKLAEKITAARARVEEAKKGSDPTVTARAEAELKALEDLDREGYGYTQDDINTSVTGRLPDAEAAAKKAEREELAKRLGVEVDKLDEELSRIEEARKKDQTEAQRLTDELKRKEGESASAQAERDKFKRQAEGARAQLETNLKRSAVRRELENLGATDTEEAKNLTGAWSLTDLSSVTVDVKVDDEGNLSVEGDVKGAKEAAEATKKAYGALFGKVAQRAPAETPQGETGKIKTEGLGGYRGNYVRPAQAS